MSQTERPKAVERRATGEGTPMNPIKQALEIRLVPLFGTTQSFAHVQIKQQEER